MRASPSSLIALPAHATPVQVGHQAAQCTSGTVNWRQIYGDSTFTLKPPQYWSEELARIAAKHLDAEDLEKQAKEFAKVGGHACTGWLVGGGHQQRPWGTVHGRAWHPMRTGRMADAAPLLHLHALRSRSSTCTHGHARTHAHTCTHARALPVDDLRWPRSARASTLTRSCATAKK
jgi:hypothetical protein